MWKIPLFDVSFDEQEIEVVNKIINSGWLTLGEVTEKFERLFSEFVGTKHAIAVSNCTAALHLANLSLNVGKGDEVICPSLSFVAGANSIVYTGAKPIFAEITSLHDFNVSPKDIEKRITKMTKLIQVVHFAGNPCHMDSIMEIANKFELFVVEDCAHALGAEYKGKKCGSIGDIGCFSFFSNKNMTTGEGGMIVTNSDELAKRIKLMRSHGMTTASLDRHKGRAFTYDVVELGFNYRIDEMRSAIGIVQLKKLGKNNARRKELSNIYMERLADIDGIETLFNYNINNSSYHIVPVLLNENIGQLEFMSFMKKKGIQTSIHYPPSHLFDYYRRNFGHNDGFLPVTEDIARREVTLPLYPSMQGEDVHYVCDSIVEYTEREEGLR